MDSHEVTASVIERETIEDEIKRIQQALGGEADEEEVVDSDEDRTLNDDSDYESSQQQPALTTTNLSQVCEPIPSTSGTLNHEHLYQLDQSGSIEGDNPYYDESVEGNNSYLTSLTQLRELGLAPDYHTCLALNRTYQELITDELKEIDILLASITEREAELSQALKDRVTLPARQEGTLKKNQMSSYAIPYFKDVDGMCPPYNKDVQLKEARSEVRAYQMIPSIWQSQHKQQLKKAVLTDAREKLLRPFMNRKELEVEKLQLAQKEISDCEGIIEMVRGESATNSDSEDSDKETDEEDICKPVSSKETKEKTAARYQLSTAREKEKGIYERILAIDKEMSEKKQTSEKDLFRIMDPNQIDWLKISNLEFDGRWDSVSCKQMWSNVQSPAINRTKWSGEENDQLLELIVKHDKRNWPKIAQELGTNRTPFQCLQHYELKMNTSHENWKDRTPFTSEEDAQLMEVVSTCKMGNYIPWTQVSFYMEDKTPIQCRMRYKCVDPYNKKGKWTLQEDTLLITQVYTYGTEHWNIIAKSFPNRKLAQCKDRWNNALNPEIRMGEWSYEEDRHLLTLMTQHNNSFSKVSNFMSGRTDSQVRKRYLRLMTWQKEPQWLDKHNDQALEELNCLPLDDLIQTVRAELVKRRDEHNQFESEEKKGNGIKQNESRDKEGTQVESEALILTESGAIIDSESGTQVKEETRREVNLNLESEAQAQLESNEEVDPACGGHVEHGISGKSASKKVAKSSCVVIVQRTPKPSLPYTSLDDPRLKTEPLLVDSIKQLRDKLEGNLVVPRPILQRKTTRELKKKALEKEKLRSTVLQKVFHAMEKLSPSSSNHSTKLPGITVTALKKVEPRMSVKEIIHITNDIADAGREKNNTVNDPQPSPKKRKRNKLKEVKLDCLLKSAVHYASKESVVTKIGRRKRFFQDDEPNPGKEAQTRAQTSAILMQSLATDAQSAWNRLQGCASENNLAKIGDGKKMQWAESLQCAFDCLKHMSEYDLVKTNSSENRSTNLDLSSSGSVPLFMRNIDHSACEKPSSSKGNSSVGSMEDMNEVAPSSGEVFSPSKGHNSDMDISERSVSLSSKGSEVISDVAPPFGEKPTSSKGNSSVGSMEDMNEVAPPCGEVFSPSKGQNSDMDISERPVSLSSKGSEVICDVAPPFGEKPTSSKGNSSVGSMEDINEVAPPSGEVFSPSKGHNSDMEISEMSVPLSSKGSEVISDVAPPSGEKPYSSNKINYKNLRPLPPSSTSLKGLRSLLLSRQRLLGKAGIAHKKLQKSCDMTTSVITMASPSKKTPGCKTELTETQLSNSKHREEWLQNVRNTEPYKVFESRFNALFLWPAFLSSIPVSNEIQTDKKQDVPKSPENVPKRKGKKPHWRKKIPSPKKTDETTIKLTKGGKRRGRPTGGRSLRNKLIEAGLEVRNQRPSARIASKIHTNTASLEKITSGGNLETLPDEGTTVEGSSDVTRKGQGQLRSCRKSRANGKQQLNKTAKRTSVNAEKVKDKQISFSEEILQSTEMNSLLNSENETNSQLDLSIVTDIMQPRGRNSNLISENETDKGIYLSIDTPHPGKQNPLPNSENEIDRDISVNTHTMQPKEVKFPLNSENIINKEVSVNSEAIQPTDGNSHSNLGEETLKDTFAETETIVTKNIDGEDRAESEITSQAEENVKVSETGEEVDEEINPSIADKGQGHHDYRKRISAPTSPPVHGESENEYVLVTKRRKRTPVGTRNMSS